MPTNGTFYLMNEEFIIVKGRSFFGQGVSGSREMEKEGEEDGRVFFMRVRPLNGKNYP